MPLTFHPKQGMVLICDYATNFILPEMTKKRPVVVITPKLRSRQLCTVVPLSTTKPEPKEKYHHQLNSLSLPGRYAEKDTWSKCDMIATVSLERLDRVKLKEKNGKRLYVSHHITKEDLQAILGCVLHSLGLDRLICHL